MKNIKGSVCLGLVLFGAVCFLPMRNIEARTTAQESKPANVEVKIDNFSFAPMDQTVAVGTTVTWINRDDIPHTVVSTDNDKTFKSKVLDTDEKFSFTFTKAGAYPYFCSIHPKMTATVTVK